MVFQIKEEGDVARFLIDDVTKQSRIFKIVEDYAFVNYFEGYKYIHRKNAPIPIKNLKVIAKAKKPFFTKKQIINLLHLAKTQ